MFGIFIRKRFLADSLMGFVDMHNHLLPGLDDGAKTLEDSISLIRGFSGIGVTNFIATPHIMDNYYPNNAHTIGNALAVVKKGLMDAGLGHISIGAAAEHMIDANLDTLLDGGSVMPIKGNYLLVEMSYLQPSINFKETILKIADKRYYPILAHPERYSFLRKESSKFKKYKERGILFQMNLLSLSNFYGKEVQKKAQILLEGGLIDFVGSDVHNEQQLEYLKNVKIDRKTATLLRPILERTVQEFS
ncbi:MAG: CpsB/CapC family capsule biosynthesis tyrosine phosphatase [Sediminicola sp.]|tara:strand:+ start:113338 stop:114078 length:741 start_codon:yes stop_codon:yes gene_type:complete